MLKLKLSEDEFKFLAEILNVAVKTVGLPIAASAAHMANKMNEAAKAYEESKSTPEENT